MSPQGVAQEKLGYGVSLHAMVLGTRAANKGFATWMREGLTKQGLLLGKAEVLVKAVATDVNSISFEMRQLQNFLLALEDRFHGPPLSSSGATVVDLDLADLLLLDCLLAKFQMSLDRVFFASSKLTSSPGLHAVESLGLSDMEALKAVAEWAGAGNLALAVQAAQQLVPAVARLVSQLSQASRTLIMQGAAGGAGTPASASLVHALCLAGTRCQVR
jgi:hypothetical protein